MGSRGTENNIEAAIKIDYRIITYRPFTAGNKLSCDRLSAKEHIGSASFALRNVDQRDFVFPWLR